MNIQKGFPTPNLPTDVVIECIEKCSICGGKLDFRHTTNFGALKVDEEAKCPDCGMKCTINQYILQ